MTRVGVAQAGSVLFDTPATLNRMEPLVEQARASGAEFLVFPEALVGGYPKGADFGTTVGTRSDQGRDEFRRYFDAAIAAPVRKPIGSAKWLARLAAGWWSG